MKQFIKKVFSLQSSVFKLFLLWTVICGLWTDISAQDNVYMYGGRSKVLQWKSAGDYSSYTLIFAALDSDGDRVLQKTLTKSYSNGYTTMQCSLYVSDTEDLTFDASYNYGIAAYGADTLQVRNGKLNLIDPVLTSFNGINLPGDGTRYYVAGTFIDTTVADGSVFVWDSTNQTLSAIGKDSLWQFLNVSDTVDTKINEAMLDFQNYSLTLLYPTTNEDVLIDKTFRTLTIDSIFCSTKDSSIAFNIYYASSRNGSTTGVFSSNQTITTPTTLTSFANATIPAGRYLIFQFSTVAGLLGEEFYTKIYYRY